ncbi:hypothetical protein FNO15_21380, partial [Salmonella enterica subsp. diarizonae]|nr:hypothetical protein [Salmonella enterica subsp. diarizonae]
SDLMCSSNPDWLTPPGAQTGRLIRAGVPRQQVAIINDVGLSTEQKKGASECPTSKRNVYGT